MRFNKGTLLLRIFHRCFKNRLSESGEETDGFMRIKVTTFLAIIEIVELFELFKMWARKRKYGNRAN